MVVRREKWESYVAFLKTRYSPVEILKEHAKDLPVSFPAKKQASPTRGGRDEIFGPELPPKTVVLTFDDGPHPRHTDRILAILKEKDVPWAAFFQVGRNIGKVGPGGSVQL